MMKRTTIFLALFALTLQGMAQKYLDIYQDGVVIKSISAAEVDSISISETQPRTISFYRDGSVFVSYSSEEVDSIKVFHENDEPLVYLGIVGFNQELYEKELDVLATSTSSQYRSFVSNLPRKDGTLLYYAVDDALDMLSQKQIDTPLSSVNLVTFTDGLDQGSLMMNGNYLSDSEYLNAISNRIASTKIKELPITAYSVGLRGGDVVDNIMFQNNLRKLSTSKDKAFEVSDMDEVRTRLQEIADQIISISTRQTFSVKIPGVSNGTLIRFTFDSKSATESQMYIEGTFNLQDRSLHDVSYHGIRSNSGSMVQGTQNGIFVTYTFTGLQREDGNGLIPTNDIRQYYRVSVSPSWQVNSEFSPANNTQRNVSHSGSAIVLALDCSSSLGTQFSNMKSYAQDFINQVAGNTMPFRVDAPQRVSASTAILDGKLLVSVTWDKAKHAESYDVYRSSSSSGSYRKVATGVTSNSWNDESPLQGNNYYYIIANGHGLTSSAKYSDKVVVFPFAAPSNVKAALDDANFVIKLNWDAVDFAEQYTIYRSSNSSSGFTQVAEGIRTSSWTDESPLSGYNYYKVEAVGYGLTSPLSSAVGTFEPFSKTFSVNGVSFNMVKVTGGTFQMGSTSGDSGEKPAHSVTLSDYYIGETEVTQELWQAVMGSNPSYFKGNKLPVECVSWNDCQAFIQKLNQLTGYNFRLPTEAEWEFAAKGGTQSKDYTYSGSNTIGDVAWYGSNSSSKTHEVAMLAPNELGIYDMSGNVWEWCQDWYSSYSSSSQTNPTGPSSGSPRAFRGGSWFNDDWICRSAIRGRGNPTDSSNNVGLRLAH